jgi:hypothetical protein
MVWILIGFLANTLIGAAVWAALDDDRRSLLHWYRSCPWPAKLALQPLALNCWPVGVWYWWDWHKAR